MICGSSMFKNIKGLNKILEVEPNFVWHHLNYIENLTYSIDINDVGDKVSHLNIMFLSEENNKIKNKVLIKFNAVNNFKLKNFGGSYNQIIGFEIIDQKSDGWESDKRYLVRDYENSVIEFYCKSIEIISVISCS